MCGIAGYFTLRPESYGISVIQSMVNSLRHRGPDDEGFFHCPHVSLGHSRLSIIDLAQGHQPMTSLSGSLQIVYNGEIYNHGVLRRQLEAAGSQFVTFCDTESILYSYSTESEDFPCQLRGMFAFAIWNQDENSLFCARDRLGIKPFYYYFQEGLFAFASEIKALLRHPSISARLDPNQLAEYFAAGYVTGAATLFSGIKKLPPGHTLRISLDHFTPEIRPFWSLPVPGTNSGLTPGIGTPDLSESALSRTLLHLLDDSVRTHLMSDVPLGLLLSGGLDSSLIAALAQRHLGSAARLRTFSIGYQETQFSELSFATDVAAHLGATHHQVSISQQDFLGALPQLVWHQDEPLAWPSNVSLYFVSKLAATHVKVVLTGEGADELFAGYSRYNQYLKAQRYLRVSEHVPQAVRNFARSAIQNSPLISAGVRRTLGHTILGRESSLESLYLDNYYGSPWVGLKPFADSTARSPWHLYKRLMDSSPATDELSRLLWLDQQTYLVELLMKQDRMSMAASIESRVPFLDHPVVEFAAGIPAHQKLRGGHAKHILKVAARGLLPDNIIYRRKMGFPTPWKLWLDQDSSIGIYNSLWRSDGLISDYLDGKALRTLLNQHRAGRLDASDRIWNLINLQIWGDVFLNRRSPEDVGDSLAHA